MNNYETYLELIAIAESEQRRIENDLPKEPMACRGLLVETVRVIDFLSLGQPGVPKEKKIQLSFFDRDMIEMGWNLATSILLKDGDNRGFPMRRSTENFRKYIISFLHQLGVISQLKRTAEMVKAGMVNVHKKDSTYIFSHKPGVKDQFLDELEHGLFQKLTEKLKSSGNHYQEWELVDRRKISETFSNPGNFMSVEKECPFASSKISDIESHMIPLIKRWDSGNHGIMLAYDSTPEIDNHFLAIATELTAEWRDETGIHPNTNIESISAGELMAVAMMIISFHIKHIQFTQIASKTDQEIIIPQSLSIWTPVKDLINDISNFSGFKRSVVEKAIDIITLKQKDINFLKKHTTKFRPLLIDIGSGFVLRPSSSVIRNPLHSVYSLATSRNHSLTAKIAQSREEWIRDHLYALYQGTRYQQVNGNIKIRKERKIITDIDACIFDNVTGELAIFQIKWQNYFSNDVKKIRSRAKNFVTEINNWTGKIDDWLNTQETSEIIKTLQLKGAKDKLTKSKIYLFGLSKNAARMQGYGYKLNNNRIAFGTWKQIIRNRSEIGPAPLVFSQLFHNLKNEENIKVKSEPVPFKAEIAGVTLNFKDIWSVVEDKSNNDE